MSDLSKVLFAPNALVATQLSHGVVYTRGRAYSADPPMDAVVVLGAFDGVHMGHRTLVAAAVEDARTRGVPCVVVTFDPDPAEVVKGPRAGDRLLNIHDRRNALLSLGVDAVVVVSFDRSMASLSPNDFVTCVLMDVMRPVSVHVGTNFRFGCGGAGNTATLEALGNKHGFYVHAHGLVEMGSSTVSSSRIRQRLRSGEVEEVSSLLGRSHFVRGVVRHGRGEGTSFGFPTANVCCDVHDCLPAEGVYACYLIIGNKAWPAATNVGAPPTFDSPRSAFLEASIVGFEGNIYDANVAVTFERWLRASRKFDSLGELKHTVLENIEWVRCNLGSSAKEVSA